MCKFLLIVSTLALSYGLSSAQKPVLGKNSNREIISAMKLEEKARLVTGMGFRLDELIPVGDLPELLADHEPAAAERALSETLAVENPTTSKQSAVVLTPREVKGAAGSTAVLPEYGIPTVIFADGPAGVRISPERPGKKQTYYCTAFPVATLLASSWDQRLVRQVGEAMGHEAREYGVDFLLAPGMNIHRNVLGGRNFEYFSEDPLLSGKMAAAIVQGIQAQGVGACVKHFAANNIETNRMTLDVRVSHRALREIYLRGFEIAVAEAAPLSVMSAYNKINGVYASQNADLLKKVLRNDWNFKGVVMTDWFAGDNPVEQVRAGNDLLMPGTPQQMDAIIAAVKGGALEERFLDENLDRILTVWRQLPSAKGYPFSDQPDLIQSALLALRAATDGMVLLKNESNALPLAKGAKSALFGIHSYDLISGGTGSGDVNEAYTISLVEGFETFGFQLDERIKMLYQEYIQVEKNKFPKNPIPFLPKPTIPEMDLPLDFIESAANHADVAILTLGRHSGEFEDRKTEDFYLSQTESNLLLAVHKIFKRQGKKIVVVLNIGGPIETASWHHLADAILVAWLPGQEGGAALAGVLSGRVNPSGKLPVTFPVRLEDEPTYANFPGQVTGPAVSLLGFISTSPARVEYQEGIFVGYRGYEKNRIQPAWPFGHGLSYTTFTYSQLNVNSTKFTEKGLIFSLKVTNSGKLPGREVVQIYVAAPGKSMDKPAQELRAFAKTRLLMPGESEVLKFELTPRDLASFDERKLSWMVEAGEYRLKAGASYQDIRLSATFQVSKEFSAGNVQDAFR